MPAAAMDLILMIQEIAAGLVVLVAGTIDRELAVKSPITSSHFLRTTERRLNFLAVPSPAVRVQTSDARP